MARVLALVPDLLFGSRLQGALAADGHEPELLGDEARLRERLADREQPAADVLVVDLTSADLDGPAIVTSLARTGELGRTRTLGFYAHVDTAARELAEHVGFDLVVPRSRINREGGELVRKLIATSGTTQ